MKFPWFQYFLLAEIMSLKFPQVSSVFKKRIGLVDLSAALQCIFSLSMDLMDNNRKNSNFLSIYYFCS